MGQLACAGSNADRSRALESHTAFKFNQEQITTLAAFASLAYESRNYGGPDPIFAINRRDNQTTIGLGLTWVPMKSWRITPQLSYIRNQSNIVINDYDRTLLSVAARFDF